MIDKIINIVPLKSATGIMYVKNGSCTRSFPQPVMPGVLIVEAFGQAAAAYSTWLIERFMIISCFFDGVDKARFRTSHTDCELHLEVEALRTHGRVWKYKGTAKVEEKEWQMQNGHNNSR